MKETIYAIQVEYLDSSGLKILDVKIGYSKVLKNTIAQYERSHRDVKVLDLWKPNGDLKITDCESGIHKLAEKYAYERKGEKFIFLQKSYDTFSKNVSLLLKKTTVEEELETSSVSEIHEKHGLIPVGAKGKQIMKVIKKMKSGKNYKSSVKEVAKKLNITYQAVADKCGRQLTGSSSDFKRMVKENTIYEYLLNDGAVKKE